MYLYLVAQSPIFLYISRYFVLILEINISFFGRTLKKVFYSLCPCEPESISVFFGYSI